MTENQAPLITRLERLAVMAETANHHINDMRVMPAAGAADLICEAVLCIKRLEETLHDISCHDIQGWAINALREDEE